MRRSAIPTPHTECIALHPDVPVAGTAGDYDERPLKGTTMATGTVKFFNTTKGFGFIQPEDGSKDVFVHISAVEQAGMSSLNEGQRVGFEIKSEPRGPKAVDLNAL